MSTLDEKELAAERKKRRKINKEKRKELQRAIAKRRQLEEEQKIIAEKEQQKFMLNPSFHKDELDEALDLLKLEDKKIVYAARAKLVQLRAELKATITQNEAFRQCNAELREALKEAVKK